MTRNTTVLILGLVGLTLSGKQAQAQVTVTLRDDPMARAAAAQAGLSEGQLKQELERLFQINQLDKYLQQLSTSYAFTTKGLGVDYASDIQLFTAGGAASVAMNAESALKPEDVKGKPPIGAMTTNWTLMAGLNLGFIGAHPLTLFGNYFSGSGNLSDEFGVKMENWGAHGMLKLFAPKGKSILGAIFQWGGLAITSGVDYSRSTLNLGQKLQRSFQVGSGNMPANVTIDSMGALDVDLETYSVPLELTTSLRLLSILTLYGGAGYDWQLGGGSQMKIKLDGKLLAQTQGQSVDVGSASVAGERRTDPAAGRPRAIAGLQVNVLLVRLFVQLNAVPDPFTASLAFGARLAY